MGKGLAIGLGLLTATGLGVLGYVAYQKKIHLKGDPRFGDYGDTWWGACEGWVRNWLAGRRPGLDYDIKTCTSEQCVMNYVGPYYNQGNASEKGTRDYYIAQAFIYCRSQPLRD